MKMVDFIWGIFLPQCVFFKSDSYKRKNNQEFAVHNDSVILVRIIKILYFIVVFGVWSLCEAQVFSLGEISKPIVLSDPYFYIPMGSSFSTMVFVTSRGYNVACLAAKMFKPFNSYLESIGLKGCYRYGDALRSDTQILVLMTVH